MAGRNGTRFVDDDYERRYGVSDEHEYRAGRGGDYYGYGRSERNPRDVEWDRGPHSGSSMPPMGQPSMSSAPRGSYGEKPSLGRPLPRGSGYDTGYYDDRPEYLPPSRPRDAPDIAAPPMRDFRGGGRGLPPGGGVETPYDGLPSRGSGPSSSLDATSGLLSSLEATIGSSALAGLASSLGQMNPVVRGQCLLLPPPGPPVKPSSRSKPPFCKTVFVGHLPLNTTRQALMDIFEPCGSILSLRFNPRNHFAHVQFDSEEAVDKAMEFTNYSIKVDLTGDPGSMGKIIVDYAVSRGDVMTHVNDNSSYTSPASSAFSSSRAAVSPNVRYLSVTDRSAHFQVTPEADPDRAAEIQSRRRAREARHRDTGKRERSPVVSTTPPAFSEASSAEVKENFRNDEEGEEASRTLVFWLEKGICNRHNTDKFFPLVQSADGCMKRVMRNKKDHEIDVRRFIAESQLKQGLLKRQIKGVSKVFSLLDKQDKKLYDLFTRGQRKHLAQWASDAKNLRNEKWFNLLCLTDENNMVTMEEEEQRKKDGREPESKRARLDDSERHLKSVKEELSRVKSQFKEKLESRDKEIAKLKEMVGKTKSDKKRRSNEHETKKEMSVKKLKDDDEIPPDSDAEEDQQLPTVSQQKTKMEEKSGRDSLKSGVCEEVEGEEEVPMVIDESEPVLQIVEEENETEEQTEEQIEVPEVTTQEIAEEIGAELVDNVVEEVVEDVGGMAEEEERSEADLKSAILEDEEKIDGGEQEPTETDVNVEVCVKVEEVAGTYEVKKEEEEEEVENVALQTQVEEVESRREDVSSLMAVVGVLASFLSVHPYGARFAEIRRYFESLNCPLSALAVWSTLYTASSVFSSHPNADDGNPSDETTWYFNGYQTLVDVSDKLLGLN